MNFLYADYFHRMLAYTTYHFWHLAVGISKPLHLFDFARKFGVFGDRVVSFACVDITSALINDFL